jgi:hypothetical protein
MTTQERINLLAEAALRAAPPGPVRPKPVTFMPSFEKLRSAEFAQPGEPAGRAADEALPFLREERRDFSY